MSRPYEPQVNHLGYIILSEEDVERIAARVVERMRETNKPQDDKPQDAGGPRS